MFSSCLALLFLVNWETDFDDPKIYHRKTQDLSHSTCTVSTVEDRKQEKKEKKINEVRWLYDDPSMLNLTGSYKPFEDI